MIVFDLRPVAESLRPMEGRRLASIHHIHARSAASSKHPRTGVNDLQKYSATIKCAHNYELPWTEGGEMEGKPDLYTPKVSSHDRNCASGY